MKKEGIVAKLKKIMGPAWVRDDDLTRYYYGSDVLTYFARGNIYPENHPLVVVYPESAGQIQKVLKLASSHRLPVYAVGGGTILLIGSMPGRPFMGITLDFHRMQKVEVDRERMVVRAEAGATGLQVSQYARSLNFGYRPCFGGSPPAAFLIQQKSLPNICPEEGRHTGNRPERHYGPGSAFPLKPNNI